MHLIKGDRLKHEGEEGSHVDVVEVMECNAYFTIFKGLENDVEAIYVAGTSRSGFIVVKMEEVNGKLYNPFDNDAFKKRVDMELTAFAQMFKGWAGM